MGRRLRLQRLGGYQHITARGNNRQTLFIDDVDYSTYLDILDAASEEFQFEVHAYSLMPNHVHDLLRFFLENMPQAIEFIHGRYARFFNERHGRIGHIFQNRYHSKLVADEIYLHEVGRYIHTNAVDAGLCERPEDYPWSSFGEYWHEAPIRVPCPGPLTAGFTQGGLLDRSAFWKFTTARRGREEEARWYCDDHWAPSNSAADARPTDPRAEAVVAAVAREFGLLPADLRPSDDSRLAGGARGLALLMLRETLPWGLEKVGRALGLKTPQGTSRAIARTKGRLESERGFREAAERVRRQLAA